MTGKDILQEGKTREKIKADKTKVKQQKEKTTQETQTQAWVRVRLIPIWLRVLLFILLLAVSLILGIAIGFSVIGDGKFLDTFKLETWQHIYDIVMKEK
jgi:hypothetical protein